MSFGGLVSFGCVFVAEGVGEAYIVNFSELKDASYSDRIVNGKCYASQLVC